MVVAAAISGSNRILITIIAVKVAVVSVMVVAVVIAKVGKEGRKEVE